MKMNPVIHFEIPTKDKKKMIGFYKKAFGWEMNELGAEMGNYVVVMTSESDKNGPKKKNMINGGFYSRTSKEQSPSLVIWVEDIEKQVKIVTKAGGKMLNKPSLIPDVGMYASFKDVEGNTLSMLQPIMKK
jgi:uncharacterized protein